MANVYDGIERYIFADLYTFYLKYKNMVNSDANWENCINNAEELRNKYKDYPLCRTLLSEILNLLECELHKKPIISKNGIGLLHEDWEKLLKDSHYFSK